MVEASGKGGLFSPPPKKQFRDHRRDLVFVTTIGHALEAITYPKFIPQLPALSSKVLLDLLPVCVTGYAAAGKA